MGVLIEELAGVIVGIGIGALDLLSKGIALKAVKKARESSYVFTAYAVKDAVLGALLLWHGSKAKEGLGKSVELTYGALNIIGLPVNIAAAIGYE